MNLKTNKIFSTIFFLALLPSLSFAQVRDSGYAGQVRSLKTLTGESLQIHSNNGRVYMIKNLSSTAASAKLSKSLVARKEVQYQTPFNTVTDKKLIDDSIAAADRFLQKNGYHFGVSRSNLVPQVVKFDPLGKTHVRYKEYCNFEVYGAELVAHLDANLGVQSVNGNVSACPVRPKNDIGESKAKILALNAWKTPAGGAVNATTSQNSIVRPPKISPAKKVYLIPSLFSMSSSSENQQPPKWEVNKSYLTYLVVIAGDETHLGGTYFMDVQDGTWRYFIAGPQALNRQIYDCNGGVITSDCAISRSEG